jgi:hypothetical protein
VLVSNVMVGADAVSTIGGFAGGVGRIGLGLGFSVTMVEVFSGEVRRRIGVPVIFFRGKCRHRRGSELVPECQSDPPSEIGVSGAWPPSEVAQESSRVRSKVLELAEDCW